MAPLHWRSNWILRRRDFPASRIVLSVRAEITVPSSYTAKDKAFLLCCPDRESLREAQLSNRWCDTHRIKEISRSHCALRPQLTDIVISDDMSGASLEFHAL